MSQRDLFTIPTCPCGDTPRIHDGAVVLWCLCDLMAFAGETESESVTKYEGWLSSLPNQQEKQNADQA